MKKKLICILLVFISLFILNFSVYASENKECNINILDKTEVKNTKPKLKTEETDSYKIKCKDVKFLHKYWVVIEILAPILVIVFGSFDFFSSVISSNEEKIKAARKKFPKRVVAAILIYAAFSIVSIIASISTNDNASDTSLIRCIVNGK